MLVRSSHLFSPSYSADDSLRSAVPLTEEEEAEKLVLMEDGFAHWNKRDFQSFIRGSEIHGRYVALACTRLSDLR